MGIFSDAQGQLTPQSLVQSGRNSNSSGILWLSLLPASKKKIQSKTKVRSCAANSKVSGGILPKFKLIQAFIVVLVTCKNEEDPIKNEGARVLTRFPHYKSMGMFSDAQGSDAQGQLTLQSMVESKFELVRDIMVVLVTCKYEKDSIKNEGASVLTRFSPL